MAWQLLGQGYVRPGDDIVELAELVAAVGTKTLAFPTDVAALIGSVHNKALEILGVRVSFTPTGTAGTRTPYLIKRLTAAPNTVICKAQQASTGFAASSGTKELEYSSVWIPSIASAEPSVNAAFFRLGLPGGLFLLSGQELVFSQDTVFDALDGALVVVRARIHR